MQRLKDSVNQRYSQVRQIPKKAGDELEKATDVARMVALRTFIAILTVIILILASVFIYGSFYFAFVPAPAHRAPLFLGFEPCETSPTKCGFLNASVHFNMLEGGAQMSRTTKGSAVLMAGQVYTVMVALRMPESPKNSDLGMFMSCLQMKSESGTTAPIKSSCKSSMMNYRSHLLRTIETVSLAPFLMSGRIVEQQTVYIEFFQDFSDNPLNPVVSADFEIKSRFAEIYDSELIIHAKFSGLRYFMFYFPMTSAVIGSSLNMALLSLVVALSWFRFFRPTPTSGDDSNVVMSEEEEEATAEDESCVDSATTLTEENKVEEIGSSSSMASSQDSICIVDDKPDFEKKSD